MTLECCEDCMELRLVCILTHVEFDYSALQDGDEV